jgi:DNA-binding NtrC family response regulator
MSRLPPQPSDVSAPAAQSPQKLSGATEMVGESYALQRIRTLIDRVAPTDRPLLICGPTGSGKEVLAQRVHVRGHRSKEPFIDVNCGAIPENLVESELFGHTKGSFTGASGYQSGFFEQVGKGTLFLDEIGELPLALQPKLLRVLESRQFRPVGSSKNLHFEGRIVAATHRDLQAMVKEGKFREDLYYRLSVFILELPSLDQRKEDIPALISHFAARQARALSFTAEAIQRMTQQTWPGNIRQLRNVIDQISVLSDEPCIDTATLLPYLKPIAEHLEKSDNSDALIDTLLDMPAVDKLVLVEGMLIDRALTRSKGNKTAAGQMLGVSRKTVERRLKVRDQQGQELTQMMATAQQLIDGSKFPEAIDLLKHCIAQHGAVMGGRRLFEAYHMLGVSLRSSNGWLYAEAQACDEAAFEAGKDCCDALELSRLQFGIWVSQLMTLELGKARATAQEMMQRAHKIAQPAALDEAHVVLANTLFWLGDCEEAIACLGRGNLLGIQRASEHIGVQGFDLAGLAITFEGLAAFQRGAFDQARWALDTLEERAGEQHQQAFNRCISLQGATWLACLFQEVERLGELATILETVADANIFTFYHGIGHVFRGCYLGFHGKYDEAEQAIQYGHQNYMMKHGGKLFHSFQAWQRGEILLQAGRAEDCYAVVSHAIDAALEQQDRAYLGELLVLKARAQGARGKFDHAEQELRGAFSTAMALGSVPARVAAAYHLALLLKQTDRIPQAAETLTRGLRGTDKLGANPHLKKAQRLLDELTFDVS